MKVLSLYDGMACGMLALIQAGIPVDRYVAYEIDKYATKTSTHNFPEIEHRGDVFQGDFTEFKGFDYLIGGSPCTKWSITQKNNRETEASGEGWEWFCQYVRALKEAEPKFFIYENNKSMSKAIKQSITDAFGLEPILINSALVSAQTRQRLYWVGKRNEDGTYSKVDIKQPEDRGILLKDILEDVLVDKDKAYCLKHQAGNARDYFKKRHTQIKYEPVRIPEYGNEDKARPINAHYPNNCGGFEHRMFSEKPNKQQVDMIAEPLNITPDGKSQTIKAQYQNTSVANICCYTSTYGASGVAESVRVGSMPKPNGELNTSQSGRVYSVEGKSININAGGGGAGAKTGLYACPMRIPEATKQGYVDIEVGDCVDLTFPNSKTRRGRSMKEKSNCLTTASSELYQYCGTIDKPIYEVKDGFITIKGKQYPIKLKDGFYIIRKLTVRECMRLQTVPEWYEFPVSDSQAYKMLGNGWTVDVIAHLLSYTKEN